jgi:hypothetical protein
MDNVKIIRMQTGEDIMASMIEKEEQNETVVLNNPMRLVFRRLPTGQTVLMMMPWLPVELIKEDSAIIYTTDIITIVEPKESMKEYYENLNMKKHLLQKYKQDRRKWSNDLNKYTCKLPVLIESQRNAFDIYLKKNAPHMLGYRIYEHEMSNISHLKVDPTHYLYWLMEFKKKNVSEIKLQKPIKPNVPKVIHGPDYLIQQLTHMRLKFITSNPNINYFIIHIKFPQDTIQYNPVYYYNIDNNIWSQKKRNFNNDVGPCCL